MKTVSIHDDKANLVLVYKEFDVGTLSPIDAYEMMVSMTKYPTILEVGLPSTDEPHYSYIGIGECKHYTTDHNIDIDPFDQLRTTVDAKTSFRAPVKVPLAGSLLGYIAYDAVRHSLRLPDMDRSISSAIHLIEHRMVLTFDHHAKKVYLSTVCSDHHEGVKALDEIFTYLQQPKDSEVLEDPSQQVESGVEVDISDEEYREMVLKAKEYIRVGDAFQIVLSRKFNKKVERRPFEIYLSIRKNCQSPYKFYIQTEDFAISGASPERLVKISDGVIENMPIAGTRPKTNTDVDTAVEQELIDDEKEHAEHMMLVDLARNDIGRVAEPGSVKVKELKKVYHYSHVMHLVSKVQGNLMKGTSPIEALKASFPAGTLSGAPKIRAMEIIDELEKSSRGIYGGAICCIDHQKRVDSFIAIRMAVIKNGVATVQAGAGIVIDSDPQKEAEETYHKAKAILNAIEKTEEVLA